MAVQTTTVSLSAVGVSTFILFAPLLSSGNTPNPMILVNLSSGASLTYNVEVTEENAALKAQIATLKAERDASKTEPAK